MVNTKFTTGDGQLSTDLQMDEKKQVWSTADIIKNRNNWTLASDVELLKHIQSLSEKLVSKSRSTLQLLNAFEDDVNSTCTLVANVNNRFEALSDTQFIENKVRDDSPETEESPALPPPKETESSENTTKKLNEALSNGIQVLRTQYDIIAVTDSESEDDEPPEVLLKARNPFMSRRLPYVIGSEEFNKHDHLGLVTSSEDEEDENDSEIDEEDDDPNDFYYVNKAVLPPPQGIDTGFKARAQVIQVSSDSDDSDVASSRSDEVAQNPVHSRAPPTTPKTPQSFADHLNATLRNMGGNVVTPLVDDVFSPPPLPSNAYEQFSEEEKSDDGSDIFAPSSKASERKKKPDIVPDIFDDEVPTHVESSPIFRKLSTAADVSQPTSKSAHPVDDSETHATPKPYASAPTVKMFSAVNAELSNRFNKSVGPTKDESDSSDEIESKSSSSSGDRKKPIATPQPDKASESKIQPTPSRDVPKPSKAHTEDIFESISSKPVPKAAVAPKSRADSTHQPSNTSKLNASQVKSKVISLFDDDDSMDDLFASKEKEQKIASPPSTTSGRKVLFNDPVDLFSPVKEPDKLSIKSTISSAASKKLALFDDDSDSGDDIFAIINSQKKKSTANVAKANVEKKPALVENEEDLVAPTAAKASSKPSAKVDLFDTKNIANEKSLPKMPSAHKGTDLFDTDDESDIFSISSKSRSSKKSKGSEQYESKSTAFESVATKNESLFEPKKEAPVPASKPSVPSRSMFLENGNGKTPDLMESDSSTKETLFDQKAEKSVAEDEVLKMSHQPSPIPRSKFPENLGNVKADVPAPRIPNDELFASEPDLPTSEDKSSKNANKPNVLPRSKNSDKTDLFASSSLDFPESVRSSRLANVPEGASTPSILSKVPDETVDGSQVSTIKPPAKLAMNRGLNINVNALLPGSSWSSISKQAKGNADESQPEESVVVAATSPAVTQSVREIESPKSVEKTPDSLTTIAKERTKLKGRRRPPSRQARVNKALQSDIFASNSSAADSADEEPDSAYKTASESNSPESNITAGKTIADTLEEKKREDSIPSFEETEFVPPTSAITNYQKERSKLAKFAKKRPPNMSKEKTLDDPPIAETERKDKTANDLGDILITASRSREPPAMIGTDFKSTLSDSDKEDDSLDDVLAESEIITDPLPEIDAESHLVLSPPVAAPRTSALFDPFADDSSDDLFASLRSPSARSSSVGGSAVMSPSVVGRPPAHPEAPASNTRIVNDSKANASTKVGVKSTSDLFSFNEDDSDDDLEALLSKVVPAKVPTTKSTGITATKETVADSKKEPEVVPAKASATKSTGIPTAEETVGDSKKESQVSGTPAREAEPPKKLDLFAEKDSLFGAATSTKSSAAHSKVSSISTRSKEEAKKPSKMTAKISADLFADDDDDDELFSSKKRPSAKAKTPVSKNLFADDDDDDDSLFGSAVPSQRGDKSTEISKPVTTTPTEKARIVKLRSQTVEKDPLTGEILK